MKNFLLILLFVSFSTFSQEMTIEKLDKIIKEKANKRKFLALYFKR